MFFSYFPKLIIVDRNAGDGSPDGSPDKGDRKRSKRQPRSKTYLVVISYATKIPMQAIADVLHGKESENFQEAVRVLDVILRQHAAKQYGFRCVLLFVLVI